MTARYSTETVKTVSEGRRGRQVYTVGGVPGGGWWWYQGGGYPGTG